MSKKELETLKIVLIGESGVGKTSIITQFVDKVFENNPQSTIGGAFNSKIIKCGNGKLLNLEIWDTAGQERYRSVTKMFYKDANAALLIYDITLQLSFDEIKNYWLGQVKESAPENVILAIVGNKIDLFDNEQVDEKAAKELAKENNAFFTFTSAKNTSGIEDLFLEIAKKYSGTDSACVIQEKEENKEYKKIKKSVKISNVKNTNKKCC